MTRGPGPGRNHPGKLFADAGALYDRARPGYPADAVAWAIRGDPARIVDLGAGTGKLTAAVRGAGREVIAIDPAEELLSRIRHAVPGVDTRIGTAEATGLPDGHADAVVAGAAFHWFTRPAADEEIARILRPGGTVALLWNPVDPDDPLYEPFARLRRRLGMRRLEFDPEVTMDRRWFGPTGRREFRHIATISVNSYVEQFASRSYVLALPPGERSEAISDARAAAAARARDGQLAISYLTTVLRAVLPAGERERGVLFWK